MRIGTLSAMFITVYPGSRIDETISSCMSLELKVSESGHVVCYKDKRVRSALISIIIQGFYIIQEIP